MNNIILDLVHFLEDIMSSFGLLGIIIAMVIQAIISPIPSELILALIGSSFSNQLTEAYIAAFIGSMLGAVIAYYLGFYFEAILKKKVALEEMKILDKYLQKYGIYTIIIARLLPFVPFDAISYFSGFVKLSQRDFLIGTAIGLIPRIAFYLLLGAEVVSIAERDFNLGLLLFVIILILLLGILYLIKKYVIKIDEESLDVIDN